VGILAWQWENVVRRTRYLSWTINVRKIAKLAFFPLTILNPGCQWATGN